MRASAKEQERHCFGREPNWPLNDTAPQRGDLPSLAADVSTCLPHYNTLPRTIMDLLHNLLKEVDTTSRAAQLTYRRS